MSVSYYKGTEIPEMNYNITVDAELQEKSIDITENGTTTIIPDSDYNALSSVTVNVNVEGSGGSGEIDLSEIGYTKEEEPELDLYTKGMEYAKEIQKNWNSTPSIMTSHYKNDKKLVFFPKVDTSNKTNLNGCFYGCSNLITIPALDLSKCTNLGNFIRECINLEKIFIISCGKLTEIQYCFYGCSLLTTIPQLDTSSVTNMSYCFYGCTSLQTIPQLDTSSVTNMQNTFNGCSSLTSIPELNTEKVTNMSNCFYGCTSLQTIPQLDTGTVTNMNSCFAGCSSLQTIPQLDTGKVTFITSFFTNCSKLKRVEGISFKSMGSITSGNFLFGYSNNTSCRYMLIKDIGTNSSCTSIDTNSARVWGINDTEVPDARQSLIDSLLTYSFDRAAAGYDVCTIKLYSTVKALLTEDEITQIQAKGYVIS